MNSPFVPRSSFAPLDQLIRIGDELHRHDAAVAASRISRCPVVRGNHTDSNLRKQDADSNPVVSLDIIPTDSARPWTLAGKLYPNTLQFVLVDSRQ